MPDKCQSYIPGSICRDGFPLGYPASSACTGRTCTSCGRYSDIVPPCQNEALGSAWLNDDGSPRHYRGTTQGASHGE